MFRGGCTLDAAEEIVDADLDTLQSLVDKSLLRHNEERYWMLETIREYAAEQLEESGEADELRRRTPTTSSRSPRRRSRTPAKPTQWLDRLEPELDNLRAALDWLEASGRDAARPQARRSAQ